MDLKAVLNSAGREQCNETLFTLLDRFLDLAFGALVEDTLKDELEIAESVLKEAGAPGTSINGVIKAACGRLAIESPPIPARPPCSRYQTSSAHW
jgi:hypothetical protein